MVFAFDNTRRFSPVAFTSGLGLRGAMGVHGAGSLRSEKSKQRSTWLDPVRDTVLAREVAKRLFERGEALDCLSTGRRLVQTRT